MEEQDGWHCDLLERVVNAQAPTAAVIRKLFERATWVKSQEEAEGLRSLGVAHVLVAETAALSEVVAPLEEFEVRRRARNLLAGLAAGPTAKPWTPSDASLARKCATLPMPPVLSVEVAEAAFSLLQVKATAPSCGVWITVNGVDTFVVSAAEGGRAREMAILQALVPHDAKLAEALFAALPAVQKPPATTPSATRTTPAFVHAPSPVVSAFSRSSAGASVASDVESDEDDDEYYDCGKNEEAEDEEESQTPDSSDHEGNSSNQ
eukprot:gene5282-6583_t